ncbi:MAG: heme-binding domain-containing protein [Deltaproteobacteria bacterium]|nr:heme-binding domain-containing protein [Deltaproteobacteria bacterium]
MSDKAATSSPQSRSKTLKKLAKLGAFVGIVVGVGIQLIPVDGIGTNPEERFTPDAPPEVLAILRKACFDCHSNETVWPLYARLAPGSWLMSRDVNKGRNKMNISEWGDYDGEERGYDKETAWEQIEKGEMPPWFYILPFHPDAKLTDAEKATLKAWLLTPEAAEQDDDSDEDKNPSQGSDAGAPAPDAD